MTSRWFALTLLSLVLATPACKTKESNPPPATTTTAKTGSEGSADTATAGSAAAGSNAAASAAGATLTDPQIAAIVVAANQVDIDASKLAANKTKNADVKKLAELMVTDHTAVNKAAVDLVTKLEVTPEETDTSKSLTAGGADNRAKLEKLDGAEFDKAYVDNEVAYHEAVINVLKSQLIPSAQNADLKAALAGVQPAFDPLTSSTQSKSRLRSRAAARRLPRTNMRSEHARARPRVLAQLRIESHAEDAPDRDPLDAVLAGAAGGRRR